MSTLETKKAKILEEFEKIFWEEIGTETDPNGTPNIYLIRNERGQVENGIDFSPELVAIKKRLSQALDSYEDAVVGEIRNMPAFEYLQRYEQADECGAIVTVSRQAIDEIVEALKPNTQI